MSDIGRVMPGGSYVGLRRGLGARVGRSGRSDVVSDLGP